jgi:hypothetical protein
MARLTMVTAHLLGKEEAVRRLNGKLAVVQERYGRLVTEGRADWKSNVFSFAFKAKGVRVAGTVTVDDSEVRWAAQVPLAVVAFKKVIEKRIRAELGDLLT